MSINSNEDDYSSTTSSSDDESSSTSSSTFYNDSYLQQAQALKRLNELMIRLKERGVDNKNINDDGYFNDISNYKNNMKPLIKQFKNKYTIIWTACHLFPGWIDYILKDISSSSSILVDNKGFIKDVTQMTYSKDYDYIVGSDPPLLYASERIIEDIDFVADIICSHPYLPNDGNIIHKFLDCISPKLFINEDFIDRVCENTYGYVLDYVPIPIRNDTGFMKRLIRSCQLEIGPIWVLEHSTPEIKANEDFLLYTIKDMNYNKTEPEERDLVFNIASLDLRGNKDFMIKAVMDDGSCLEHANESIKNDPDVVKTAIEYEGDYGHSYIFASQQIRQNDKDIAIMAIQTGRYMFDEFEPDMMNNKDVAIAAIQMDRCCCNSPRFGLDEFSDDIRNDIDVAMVAVKKCGLNLQYLSPDLRNNKKVVLVAVQNNHQAIRYSSESCQCDIDIVLASELQRLQLTSINTLNGYEQLPFYFERANNCPIVIYHCLLYHNILLPAVSEALLYDEGTTTATTTAQNWEEEEEAEVYIINI